MFIGDCARTVFVENDVIPDTMRTRFGTTVIFCHSLACYNPLAIKLFCTYAYTTVAIIITT